MGADESDAGGGGGGDAAHGRWGRRAAARSYVNSFSFQLPLRMVDDGSALEHT